MNYDIKVRGFKDDVSTEDGEGLKQKWEAFMLKRAQDELVEVGGWTGLLSDIRSMRKVASSASEKSVGREEEMEYRNNLTEIRKMNPEKRAKRLGLFRLMYWGFTGKRSEEVIIKGRPVEELAIEAQAKFFKENPKRIFPDYDIFRHLIKSEKCNEAIIRIIDNQSRQDRFAAKFI